MPHPDLAVVTGAFSYTGRYVARRLLDQGVRVRDFDAVAEPDAAELASLRNQTEHRFLSLQHSEAGMSNDTRRLIPIGDFQGRTLRLLKMAREALIFLSLAMDHEEVLRKAASKDESEITGSLQPRQIETFRRPEVSDWG